MTKKILNIKERVLYFAEKQEVTKQIFFKKTGLNYSNFTGKSKESDLNSKAIKEILLKYPEVNPEWLILGIGDMLKKNDANTSLDYEYDLSIKYNVLKIVDYYQIVIEIIEEHKKQIYEIKKVLDLSSNFKLQIDISNVEKLEENLQKLKDIYRIFLLKKIVNSKVYAHLIDEEKTDVYGDLLFFKAQNITEVEKATAELLLKSFNILTCYKREFSVILQILIKYLEEIFYNKK